MQSPRTLAAVFLSAAFLLNSGIALADKGGNGKGHGNSGPSSGAAVPGGSGNQAGPQSGPPGGGAGPMNTSHGNSNAGPGGFPGGGNDKNKSGPAAQPGSNSASGNDSDRSTKDSSQSKADGSSAEFRGDVDSVSKNTVSIKLSDGSTRTFQVDDKMAATIKARAKTKGLVFFSTDGVHVTSVSAVNETARAQVVSMNGTTLVIRTSNGEMRLLGLDQQSIKRLHLRQGSEISVTTRDENTARVISMDQLKKHWGDKFAGKRLARSDAGVEKSKSKSKTKNSDSDRRVADADQGKGKCGEFSKSSGRGHAYDVQMAQLARMSAKGQFPPGLPHQCVNPAGNTRGWCKTHSKENDVDCSSGGGTDTEVASVDQDQSNSKAKCGESSSKSSGRGHAYDVQMAQLARMSAKGQNPPGLPHQCVNPAGHTRGWCKSGSKESDVDCSGSSGGGSEVAAAQPGCEKSTSSNGRHGHAYDVQMAQLARMSAKGQFPPGLPHQCVNPAGHTRGWCKTKDTESSAVCASSVASSTGSSSATVVSGAGANGSAVVNGPNGRPAVTAPNGSPVVAGPNGPVGGRAPAVVPGVGPNGAPIVGGSNGIPVAMAPPAPATGGKSAARRPTRVKGASVAPAPVTPAAIHLVRPLATTPCVWHKTAVLGAARVPQRVGYYRPYHRAYTSYSPHRPHVHTACH